MSQHPLRDPRAGPSARQRPQLQGCLADASRAVLSRCCEFVVAVDCKSGDIDGEQVGSDDARVAGGVEEEFCWWEEEDCEEDEAAVSVEP